MIFAGAGPEVVEERRFVEPVPSFDDLTAHQRDVCRRSAEGNQASLRKRAAISARFGDNLRSIIRLCQWGDLGYKRTRSTWMSTATAKPTAAQTRPTTTASTIAWARKARTSAAPSARDRRMDPCCDP